MDQRFGGVIWTKHALSRLGQRGLPQSEVFAVWRRPDDVRYAKAKEAWIYYRTFGNRKIEVVARQNEKKEWIIMSVWSKYAGRAKPDRSPLWLKTLKFIFRV